MESQNNTDRQTQKRIIDTRRQKYRQVLKKEQAIHPDREKTRQTDREKSLRGISNQHK